MRPSRSAKTAAAIKITTQSTVLQDKDEEFELLREAEMEEENAAVEKKKAGVKKKEEKQQEYDPNRPTHLVPGTDIAPGILTEVLLCHCNGSLINNVRAASPALMRFSYRH